MPRRPKVKRPLTIADLPAPTTNRWVIRRKAEVLAAVHGGLVSLEDVCSRYMLTVEEFLSWQYSIDRHGLAGLRHANPATAIRGRQQDHYRDVKATEAGWGSLCEQGGQI